MTYGCVDIWMCKSIALKLRCLRVAYLLEVLHSISREAVLRTAAAPFEPTRLITRLITRLLLRFELPGWYFGTTRLIIRPVVQLIIRLVVNYQLQADNPADNPVISLVVYDTH